MKTLPLIALAALLPLVGCAAPAVMPAPAVQARPHPKADERAQNDARRRDLLLSLADRVGDKGLTLYFVFSRDFAARNSEYEYGTTLPGLKLIREPIGSLGAAELRALAHAGHAHAQKRIERLEPEYALACDEPGLEITVSPSVRDGITVRAKGMQTAYLDLPELHAHICRMMQAYHKGRGRTLDEGGMPVNEPQRRALIERLASLPANSVYEESPGEFRQRLEAGRFRFIGGKYELGIGGDGCIGPRTFYLNATPDGDRLSMLMDLHEDDGGPDTQALYRYNPKTGDMEWERNVKKPRAQRTRAQR